MTIAKRLVEFVIYPAAMAAGAGLCLWVLLGPLHVDRLAIFGRGAVVKADLPADPNSQAAGVSGPDTAAKPEPSLVPVDRPAGVEAGAIANVNPPLVPGDSGALVTRMQGALVEKGYGVGLAGADGNFSESTLTALQAFQDNNALPVQPKCDQECWTALDLPRPE
jgi:peptidoglycan hydrolase-like protein with peptidoglycan-binding domain